MTAISRIDRRRTRSSSSPEMARGPIYRQRAGFQMVQRMGLGRSWPLVCSIVLTQAVPFIGESRLVQWPTRTHCVGDRVFFSSMAVHWNSNEDREASGRSLASEEQNLGSGWPKHTSRHGIWPIGWCYCLLRGLDRSSPRSLTLAEKNSTHC